MSARPSEKTDATDSFFAAFRLDAPVKTETYMVAVFGGTEGAVDAALGLVLLGIKRAHAWPRLDDTILPVVGSHSVIVDGRGKPRAVLRTTDVRVGPLASVDAPFLDAAGADTTREAWIAAEIGAGGPAADADIPYVFQRFTILWPRLLADGPKRLTF